MSGKDQNKAMESKTKDRTLNRRSVLLGGTTLAAASALTGSPTRIAQSQPQPASAQAGRLPNVLAILADDIGWFDVGCYHRGMMGVKTPNIDRIAREGVMFTDAYAQASCTTKGRAAQGQARDEEWPGDAAGAASGASLR